MTNARITYRNGRHPADFTPSMIKGVKVVFTPSVELKTAIEEIHFEKAE